MEKHGSTWGSENFIMHYENLCFSTLTETNPYLLSTLASTCCIMISTIVTYNCIIDKYNLSVFYFLVS